MANAPGPIVPLETERLRLVEFTAADAPFILRLLNEPSFIANIADRGVRSLDDALRYLDDGPRASYARNGFGLWKLELREGATPIGMCGLIRRDSLPDVDLGYALVPEHVGRGYVQEAAQACLGLAQRVLGLRRVVAIVSPGNARSIAVLERLGFAFERRMELVPGDEVLLFGKSLGEVG